MSNGLAVYGLKKGSPGMTPSRVMAGLVPAIPMI
jgi:hypothetical protein